jgi:AcrR family transcriptional regulator
MLVTNISWMGRAEDTHQRIQDVALELFSARGFDAVTVEEIAAAAGVSHMTFFRNFPTKESVVASDPYDPLIAALVAAQPSDLAAMERVRSGLMQVTDRIDDYIDATARTRIDIGIGNPKLRAVMWENTHETEDAIVAALVRTGTEPFAARVAAGACLGAIMAALLDWARDDGGEKLGDRIRRALDQFGPVTS